MSIARNDIKALREKRAKAVADAGELLTLAATEKRELSADEETRFNAFHAEADKLMKTIEREERQMDAEASTRDRIDRLRGEAGADGRPQGGEAEKRELTQRAAYRNWLRYGHEGLSAEERQIMREARPNLTQDEQRNLGIATAGAGGATVPQGFFDELERRMLAFGGMRTIARRIRTARGNTLPMPTVDDTSNVATIVAEAAAVGASVNPTFGSVNLGAFMYRSITTVSLELLQDSAFDVEAMLADLHAERFARGQNAHFTVGTGTGQPRGVMIDTAAGRVGPTGQTTTVTYADLVFLEHSLDPMYRAGARFMMHDSTLGVVKRLLDGQNRPLWMAGVGVGAPDRILGYPYTINQAVAVMAANARSIAFGEFQKYFIRDVSDMVIVRLAERYIDLGLIGFVAFMRSDARLLDAGGNPVRHYANSAT